MPLNTRLLRLSVYNQADRAVTPEVKKLVKIDFNVKKEEMLKDFDEHPVTIELKAGPKALSHYISETEGNLFSLLGFDSGDRPTVALRRFLKDNTTIGTTRKGILKGDFILYETPVNFPTVKEVDEAMEEEMPLPWADDGGRSFTSLIQNGITGIHRYLFSLTRKFPNSHSGTAIQASKALRPSSESIKAIKYVNGILSDFKKKFIK